MDPIQQRLTGNREEISGFVLAGGRSSRLGQDKVLLPWNDQTLLSHSIQRLQQVCQTVRVCADRGDLDLPDLAVRYALPGTGPLSAIVSALEQSLTPWNLFLAVDLPLVPVELLKALSTRAENSRALCIVPQAEGLPQPLCGLYHRSLAPGLRVALQEGKYKIMLALRDASMSASNAAPIESRVELFDVQKFAASYPQSREWILNINTPQDWQRARELASPNNY